MEKRAGSRLGSGLQCLELPIYWGGEKTEPPLGQEGRGQKPAAVAGEARKALAEVLRSWSLLLPSSPELSTSLIHGHLFPPLQCTHLVSHTIKVTASS